jgi:aminoglycoside phosphotransferase (APT) family kinase protein
MSDRNVGAGRPTERMFERDLDRLAIALEKSFPRLAPVRPLSVLGRGFRSLAVENAGGHVVRVGLCPDAAEDYAKEWSIGRFLVSHLGAVVPEPLWYAEPCADLPHGGLAYKKLAGEPPAWGVDPGVSFARDLGAFMARVHELPVEEARTAGVPEIDSYTRLLGARDVVMPVLESRLEAEALARVARWWAVFSPDVRMRTARIAVCLHDLWHENLLRSESGGLSGVLDIAHVEISDPAHDFAAPRYFGERFADVISGYRSAGGRFDADDRYRADRFHEGREFGGLAWAIEHDDAPEIEASVQKIIEGPILARQAAER